MTNSVHRNVVVAVLAWCWMLPGGGAAAQEVGPRNEPTRDERWVGDDLSTENLALVDVYPVAGTRLYVRPPLGFRAMEDGVGYRHSEKNIAVYISELRGDVQAVMDSWMSENGMITGGVDELHREKLIAGAPMMPGLLVQGLWNRDLPDRRGVSFAVYGSGTGYIVFQVRHPAEEREYVRLALIWLMTGSLWDISAEPSPLAPLPVRMDVPEDWFVAGVQGAAARLRASEESSLAHPSVAHMFIFAQAFALSAGAEADPVGATVTALREQVDLAEVEIDRRERITIGDGREGVLLTGECVQREDGQRVWFAYVAAYGHGQRHVAWVRLHPEEDAASREEMIEVVRSLRMLRQSDMRATEEPEVTIEEPGVFEPVDPDELEEDAGG